MPRRVLVIGAGLAGLSATRTLVGHGIDVQVLEARARVGGRIEGGFTEDGTPVELGGQWVGTGQTRAYELIEELGLAVFGTYNSGEHMLRLGGKDGRVGSDKGAVPRLNPFVLADLFRGLRRFNSLAATVPLEAPWTARSARELDSMTLETWVGRNLRTETGRNYFRVMAEAVFAAESADVSMLHSLFYAHSGADLETLLSVDRGAQKDRVVGGTIRIAERMAEELGDLVRLDTAVSVISDEGGRIRAVDRSGGSFEADRIIVAVPPTLAGRLIYEPALPPWRDQLTQKMPAGSVIKFHVIYEKPFWRDEGLTGQVASDEGPVKVLFDNSPPDAGSGILVGFFEGDEARRWSRRTKVERREAVATCLEGYFGIRARRIVEYIERDWSAEEFSRGCYGAHFAPGVWTSFGEALREPVGNIHWAGAEYSTVWNGYMEGAIRSGEAAASSVIELLY